LIDSVVLKIGVLFFLAGIIFWGGFNWSLEATNNEAFCISCHEMENNVYQEYRQSVHFANRTGVRASCPDCHVPKQWAFKLMRKVQAVNELYHKLTGSIDTREKFLARRPLLAAKVWKTMKKTDSRECRNCHSRESMRLEQQTPKAAIFHGVAQSLQKTCIDCHQGIAHTPPEQSGREKTMDEVHVVLEQQKLDCHTCHENMAHAPEGDGWD
jgi:cytochrome c-type protein NapC